MLDVNTKMHITFLNEQTLFKWDSEKLKRKHTVCYGLYEFETVSSSEPFQYAAGFYIDSFLFE